jgi:phage terminase large subunit-like protein
MKYNPIAKQYEDDILSGRIKSGKLLRLAIERQRRDLKNGHERGIYFSHEEGQKILEFAEVTHLSPDEPIQLAPFQVWELYVFYGWRKEDGRRRFRSKFKTVARKNGKTPLESLQILYHLTVENLFRAEAYVSATKEDQAKIAFDDAKFMVEYSPELQEYLSTSATTIFNNENKAKFQFLTSNPKTADGTRPSYAVIDEYHEFDNDDMLGKLRTGMIHRKEPIFSIVTTRGTDKSKPMYAKEERIYIPILKGIILDDSVFIMMFSLDEEDLDIPKGEEDNPNAGWKNPKNFIKANPMLGHILNLEDMIKERDNAILEGEESIVKFKTLNLNMWVDAAKTWIEDEIWMRHGTELNIADYEGKECYGGLDMAKRDDFISFCLTFPRKVGDTVHFDKFWWHWIPDATVRKRIANGMHNLREWLKDGWIFTTEGNVTDYTQIEKHIKECFDRFDIRGISYDRHNIGNLDTNLVEYGVNMRPFAQTIMEFSEPTKFFKNSVKQGRINHGNNPVMRWQMTNAVEIIDTNENTRISKRHSREKVDGVIAAIMATGEYQSQNWGENEGPSIYETQGIRTL